jgi:hypothetical protein
MRSHHNLKIGQLLLVLVFLILSLISALGIAEDDYKPVSLTIILLILTATINFGSQIYIIIPIFWSIIGSVYLLPIPFSIRDLAKKEY